MLSTTAGAEGGTDCPQSVGIGPGQRVGDNTFRPFQWDSGRSSSPWRNQLHGLRHRSRRRTPSRGSLILRTAEAKNREENNSQQSKADSEAYAFADAFGQIDAENNCHDEVNKRNEHQQNPPPWTADNLAPNVNVIDGDDAGPTGLAGFGEHFPHRHYQQQRNEQSENHRDWTWRLALSAVIDLCEQACGREQNG